MTAQVRGLVVTLLGRDSARSTWSPSTSASIAAPCTGGFATRATRSRGLIDAVRRELAARYLEDRDRTLAEISSLLGFAAPSGFSRWYRRQHRAPPSTRRTTDGRHSR